jgi:hypothetical protein
LKTDQQRLSRFHNDSKELAQRDGCGFMATVVLSAFMLMKEQMGLVPQLNPLEMLAKMAGGPPAVGWVPHFLIGTVLWGSLFPIFDANVPSGSHWLNGILFGFGAWILMMVLFMPMAGAGLFGMALGVMAPIAALVLHLIYGFVLGGTYGLEHPDPLPQFQVAHWF